MTKRYVVIVRHQAQREVEELYDHRDTNVTVYQVQHTSRKPNYQFGP